jgi:hypothetical protein
VTTQALGDERPDHHRLRLALLSITQLANGSIDKALRCRLDQAQIEGIHRDYDMLKARVRDLAFNWDDAKSTTIEEFRSPTFEHVAVRLRCQIIDVQKAVQIEVSMEEEADLIALLGNSPKDTQDGVIKTLRTIVTVMGETGQEEKLLPITDRQLIEHVVSMRFEAAYFEILAIVVTPPVIEGSQKHFEIVKPFQLLCLEIRPLKTALQLVAPTPGDLQSVDHEYRNISAPLPFIMEKISRYLGIKGLDRLTILNEALEFQVFSALTEGQRGSTAVIGPPGVGKRMIGMVAKLLQPIAREALPTKVTEAGLIGNGSMGAKKDMRHAGLLPQSDQGAFIVQDWNQANSNKNQRLTSSLATTMQDGMVYDSSASQRSYRAEVSLVIDANRQSDVKRTDNMKDLDGLARLVIDTKLPTNMLTRFTYIAEIPRSVSDQILTLSQILEASGERREDIQAAMAHEMHLLKVWLARLREIHRKVIIPEEVATRLSVMVTEAINVGATRLNQRAEYGDFMVRLAEQAVMLTKAHARLHNRSTAIVSDVEGIFPYLHRKMSFVRSLLFGADIGPGDVKASAPGRQTLMRLRLKPGNYTAKQVQKILCLLSCSESAIAEDLRALFGDPEEGGAFHVGA